MTYLEWNNRLTEYFFSPEKAGRNVHLFATRELIEKLGQASGAPFQDFIESVKKGPEDAHRSGFCQRALEALRDWRHKLLPYPPYVAYLALFVIAAGQEGDFAAHAYYPRLWKLLGEEPHPGAPPSFDKMLRLWDDLEKWSNVDKQGQWGVFRARLFGEWINVGVPLAQTFLSEEERHVLPTIFARAGLDPTSPPSERELACILRTSGKHMLRKKTLHLLKNDSQEHADLRQAFVEIVLNELREWNGLAEDVEENTQARGQRSYWPLRLCCKLDMTAETVRMSLRCKAPAEFPENGFTLSPVIGEAGKAEGATGEALVCEEWQFGWSTPLEDTAGRPLDAADLDWTSGLELQDCTGGSRFRLPASPVRLLIDGSSDGLGSLVEVRRLPAGSKFFIVVHAGHCEAVEKWGVLSCDGWKELKVSSGLPAGWRLFSAERARSDELVKDKYPLLSLPAHASILLRGGIRVSRGNRYFYFAPPSAELQGTGIDQLLFNGVAVAASNLEGCYNIPSNLPALPDEEGDKILIEAQKAGHTIDRVSIYLARGGWPWLDGSSGVKFDKFGGTTDAELESFVRGAMVRGIGTRQFDFSGAIPFVEQGAIHYVGRQPGQIVHWPHEPLPKSWSPVWLIVTRRKGKVVFCGTDVAKSEPVQASCVDRKKLKAWKNLMWWRRNDLTTPSHPVLQRLWQRYLQMAKDV